MKGKYLVILLLIITFICAFCKYSKNVQVRELFIDDKEVKELFNTGSENILELNNLKGLNLECDILNDESTIKNKLNEIHDLYDSALDSIDNTGNTDTNSTNPSIDTIKNKYVEELTNLNNSYNDFIAQDYITLALAETKESINTDETPCKGYIIPLKKNEEKIVNIGSAISAITDKKNNIDTEYNSLNKDFESKIATKQDFLERNETNFIQTNDSIINTLNNLKLKINTLLIDEDNISYQKRIGDYCDEKESALSDLIGLIGAKITQNTTTISDIDEIISTYLESPTIGDQPNAKYNGIDNEDLSIREHCNIGVNGSGICYEPEYQGCNIECDLKSDGECKTFKELGYPNPQKYTNIFGESIKVHTHSHDHDKPQTHEHDKKGILRNLINNKIDLELQKLNNIENNINKENINNIDIELNKLENSRNILENVKDNLLAKYNDYLVNTDDTYDTELNYYNRKLTQVNSILIGSGTIPTLESRLNAIMLEQTQTQTQTEAPTPTPTPYSTSAVGNEAGNPPPSLPVGPRPPRQPSSLPIGPLPPSATSPIIVATAQ